VLGLGAATRIFVATGVTDMRLGFNGLYALAAGQLQQDPQSGHLFLFANKRRDRMKILFFDGSSLWVCARRMAQLEEQVEAKDRVIGGEGSGACCGRCDHPAVKGSAPSGAHPQVRQAEREVIRSAVAVTRS
jgi:hypothetical protein